MKVVLLGAPGSGKGTQANKITEKFSVAHISTGDIFRENIKNNTPLGLKVKDIMDKGNLCPDSLTIELVKDRLQKPDCKNGYLLDGFPRNLVQAEALNEFDAPDKVINLEIDTNKLEKRITGRRSCGKCGGTYHINDIGDAKNCPKCGNPLSIRKDDTAETVKSRLTVYGEQTSPLIKYYAEKGVLYNVDGDQEVDKVFSSVAEVLKK